MSLRLPDSALAPGRYAQGAHLLTDDLAYQRLLFANVVYVGTRSQSGPWILVDAGVAGSAAAIRCAAALLFDHVPPQAVILTHGHFDHVGTLRELLEHWKVPVYAHELEMPYLNGTTSYPPPNPAVGGGPMSKLARLDPRSPINVSKWLQKLPADGTVPHAPGWQWIHTPGHTVGHVSLWRASDRTVVAGDAVITTNPEAAYAVGPQSLELHSAPAYCTMDGLAAHESAEALAKLEPELLITGHGKPACGEEMRNALCTLAHGFSHEPIPEPSRYLRVASRRGAEHRLTE